MPDTRTTWFLPIAFHFSISTANARKCRPVGNVGRGEYASRHGLEMKMQNAKEIDGECNRHRARVWLIKS